MSTESLIGKTGRVTGTVGPDRVGEVILDFGEGTAAYPAFPYENDEVLEEGARVIVMDVAAARNVYVSKLPY